MYHLEGEETTRKRIEAFGVPCRVRANATKKIELGRSRGRRARLGRHLFGLGWFKYEYRQSIIGCVRLSEGNVRLLFLVGETRYCVFFGSRA